MSYIKTGCHVYIQPTNSWAYGDAFEDSNLLILRLVAHDFKEPVQGFTVKHFTVEDWLYWFDEPSTSMKQPSTMICNSYTNHGYEGIPL